MSLLTSSKPSMSCGVCICSSLSGVAVAASTLSCPRDQKRLRRLGLSSVSRSSSSSVRAQALGDHGIEESVTEEKVKYVDAGRGVGGRTCTCAR